MARYWLTPPELEHLREGRFDPYPYPHEFGDWNALLNPWKKPWYANPPFHALTKHVRRAIEQGGPGILVMPIGPANALILKAGLTMKYLGRIGWIDPDTGRRGGSVHTVAVRFPESECNGGREMNDDAYEEVIRHRQSGRQTQDNCAKCIWIDENFYPVAPNPGLWCYCGHPRSQHWRSGPCASSICECNQYTWDQDPESPPKPWPM